MNPNESIPGRAKKPEPGMSLRGREALSTGAAINAQIALMRLMIPDRIRPYFNQSNGNNIGIEDKLFERWVRKYSIVFNQYCDQHAGDSELFHRMESGKLSNEDLINMKTYVEEESGSGAFFTDAELDEFLKIEIH